MESIIGTWSLVSLEVERKDAEKILPFGEKAKGLLIYREDGYMSGIISGENRPSITSPALFGIDEQERASIARNFIAYAGKYTVENDRIIHNVEVSFVPNLMEKPVHVSCFSLNGDQLIITSPRAVEEENGMSITLTWERRGKPD